MKKITSILSILLMTPLLSAQIIHVPADHSTIQAAINTAVTGDTVLVAEGTYLENINFKGKAITVASLLITDGDTSHVSKTIIDGSGATDPDSASVVYMISGEDSTSVLNGFTITGGGGTKMYVDGIDSYFIGGGGLFLTGGKIVNNKITGNIVESVDFHCNGGGIWGYGDGKNSFAIIRNNEIYNNQVTANLNGLGGGMLMAYTGSNALIEGNRIFKNIVTSKMNNAALGGGIFIPADSLWSESLIIRNNYIFENELTGAEMQGGGIYVEIHEFPEYIEKETSFLIYNNVIADNITQGVGGGIFVLDINNLGTGWTTPAIAVFNNTIVGNQAVQGAGIWSVGPRLLLFNNIFWNDLSVDGCVEVFCEDDPTYWIPKNNGVIHAYYNAIQEGYPGGGNIKSDPLLDSDEFSLLEGSKSAGAGVDSLYLNGYWFYAPNMDLTGIKRSLASEDHKIDLGALESSFEGEIPAHYSEHVINVPAEQSSIQAAIDAAADHDTVLVAPGIYYENIDFKGKAITVASHYAIETDEFHITNTVIDGSLPLIPDSASVVRMVSGEDTTSILKGFTITGGNGIKEETGNSGGGVFTLFSGGIIDHNIICNNHVTFEGIIGWAVGGGISASTQDDRTFIVRNNIVSDNSLASTDRSNGGGISLGGSNFRIEHNKIFNNVCDAQSGVSYGGGIGWWSFDPPGYDPHVRIANNEIYRNKVLSSAPDDHTTGGGIRLISTVPESEVDVYNNLIYDNSSVGSGGGIAFWGTNDAICRNNTVYNNKASRDGKSIYQNGGSVIFFNNIVWTSSNTKNQIVLYNGAGLANLHAHYNLIKGGWEGNSNFIGDPDLEEENFELYQSSLCVDRGTESFELNGDTYNAPAKDMDGKPRPHEGNTYTGVDLGALESDFELLDYFEMTFKQETGSGVCNVTVTLMAEGGVPPYSYYVDDVELESNIIEELCSGEYKFSIVDAMGAERSVTKTIVGIVDELSDDSAIHVYPNPANDRLTVESTFPGEQTLEIMNVNGQKVFSSQMNGTSTRIDLSEWNSGVYVLMIRSSESLYTGKIVKY